MPPFLKVKTAGLPRWAWVAMIGGAVGIGLYLRHRSAEAEEPEAEEEEPGSEDALGAYEGTESAGGLAAAGLVGPAQGQITPVEAPYVPQGVVDIMEQEANVISELGAREPTVVEPTVVEGPERIETTIENTPVAITGGGPTKRKPHQKHPKKPPKKRKQPQHKQPKHKQPKHKRPPKKHRTHR